MQCYFCNSPISDILAQCRRCSRFNPITETEYLIAEFFRRGYAYSDILDSLETYHDISISDRTLRRILADLNLRRRNNLNPVTQQRLHDVVAIELAGPARDSGYRAMQMRLQLHHGLNLPRSTVQEHLRSINPTASANRRYRRLHRRVYENPGPNAVWHLDGKKTLIIQ